MLNALAIAALGALALVAAAPARAQEARPGPYGGISVSQFSYQQSGSASASLTGIGGVLGTVVNPHFAIEVRAGLGLDDDQITVGASPANVELGSYFSGLLKGILPLAPRFGIYGVAGGTIGKFAAESNGLYVNKWESDFTYGAGAEIGFAPNMSLGLEWLRMFEGSGYRLDAVSLAFSFRF
ncbi:MAG TPA: porin family protein [Burkholderiales bacterium]|jgi:opacity protein-like surface antigen|nr:porin family protein [Burkholderiales bacterium]